MSENYLCVGAHFRCAEVAQRGVRTPQIAGVDLHNPMDYIAPMLTTVTELPEYIRRASEVMTDEERALVVSYLAAHPRAGDVMVGTGGIRKLRWAIGNRGKSGGVRVIYYYHDERIPLYLLTLFAKNERANLSKAERNMLAGLVDVLVETALERNDG